MVVDQPLCWTAVDNVMHGYKSEGNFIVSKVRVKKHQPVFKDQILFELGYSEGQPQVESGSPGDATP